MVKAACLESRRPRVRIPLWPLSFKQNVSSPLTRKDSILWGASVNQSWRARPHTARDRISNPVSGGQFNLIPWILSSMQYLNFSVHTAKSGMPEKTHKRTLILLLFIWQKAQFSFLDFTHNAMFKILSDCLTMSCISDKTYGRKQNHEYKFILLKITQIYCFTLYKWRHLGFVVAWCLKYKIMMGFYVNFNQDTLLIPQKIGAFIRR